MLNPLAAKKQLDNLRPYKSDRSDALNLAKTSFIIHPALQLTFSQLESLFSNTNNELYWEVVRHFSCPSKVLNVPYAELSSFILNSTRRL